ncbi:MAG: sigma-54-dependent Fis family transcriptional regulator [Deltaproteobacteria bacterium]|nr:sigma-54-dependent Fis family transcriptional regulator [Deltaproteobacteria bacterium]
MNMPKVLVVDDDLQIRKALVEVLQRKGFSAASAESGQEALALMEKDGFDAIVTDLKMPGMDGVELLRSVRQRASAIPVIIMTAYGTIENAIEAMKLGAEDYVLKPFSPELIDSALRKALASKHDWAPSGIVFASPKMKDLLGIASGIASSTATILITGESGTGKELLARFIHSSGNRKDGPLVSINCASIPEGLLESELFGFEKGAFTGAFSKRVGKFEAAHGGTLLLDEVGEMTLSLQAKLLRVLQLREVDRIGANKTIPVDIRVIATTNRELRKEVVDGRFREDLFYRLNVFPLAIPPLRERPEDIPELAMHFLAQFASRYSRDLSSISKDAMELMKKNLWKGNVRELENVMERAVLIANSGEITSKQLFYGEEEVLAACDRKDAYSGTLRDMEKNMILDALKDTRGNRTMAARKLGISIRTLRNKLTEYSQEERVAR